MQTLRQEIEERFPSGRFSWADVRPHDAAGLLKQFLRDLPTPLLSFQYLDAFAAVQSECAEKGPQQRVLIDLGCLTCVLLEVLPS